MKHAATPDFTNMANTMKKNAEIITSATEVAAEGACALLRRGAEIAQNRMTASFNVMKEMNKASKPEDVVSRQQEFIKSSVEDAVSDTKEMIDLASKSAMEMFSSIGTRFSDHLNDSLNIIKK